MQLHEFATNMLQFIRQMVEFGIDNEQLFHKMLNKFVRLHEDLGLSGRDFHVSSMILVSISKRLCI